MGYYIKKERIDEDTGRHYIQWIWVPTPPPPAKKSKPGHGGGKSASQNKAAQEAARRRAAELARRRAQEAARRRAPELARRRAQEAARRRAAEEARRKRQLEQAKLAADQRAEAMRADAQRRAAEARRAAYEELKRRQAAILRQAGLTDGGRRAGGGGPRRPGGKPPVTRPTDPTYKQRRMQEEAFARRDAAAEEARQKAIRQAEIDKWTEYGYRQRKAAALRGDEGVGIGDIERLLAEEVKRGGKGMFDGASVQKLAERYEQHAETVAVAYNLLVKQLNKLLDAGDIKGAREVYYGDFARVMKEYVRLFGDGSDPTRDGAYNQFFKNVSAIDQQMRDWWKRQIQATLDSDRASVNDHIHDLSAEIRKANRLGEGELAKSLAGQQAELMRLSEVYAGKTSTITWVDPQTGRTMQRQRTVEEELEYRAAQKRIEMERLRAQMETSQARQRMLAHAEGMVVGADGRLVSQAQSRIQSDMLRIVQRDFGGKPPNLNTPQDLVDWADRVMSQWDRTNKKPSPPKGGNRSQGYNEYLARLTVWNQSREKYEKALYEFYGQTPPALWDRAFGLPGISHTFAALQGGVAAIGAGGRILLKNATGQSQLKSAPSISDLPDGIRQRVEAAGSEFRAPKDPFGQPISVDIGGKFLQGATQQQVLTQWLNTPEGAVWLRQWTEANKARMQEEDYAFLKGFYGPGDIGQKLQALIDYGTMPVGDAGGDLLFQLLADPTNAIPLKFTTYLARAKFAAEQTGKYGKVAKVPAAARDFVKVDEGTLRLRSELDKIVKKSGVEGLSARQLTDELLLEVGGIADKTARQKAIRAKLVQLGLSPQLVNDTQLFNLIEQTIKDRLATQKIGYRSQADIQKELREAAEADRKAATEARRAKQRATERKLAEGRKVRQRNDAQARARVTRIYRQEQARGNVTGMTEDEWWSHLLTRARNAIRDPNASAAAKARARGIIHDVTRAREGRKAERHGSRYVDRSSRLRHQQRVAKLHGKDASELLAPRTISPLVTKSADIGVERARTLFRTLTGRSPKLAPGGPQTIRVGGRQLDYLPWEEYVKLDKKVSDAVADVRGFRADQRTHLKAQAVADESSAALIPWEDSDPVIRRAKERALRGTGVTVRAYDEARRVFWRALTQGNAAEFLLKEAETAALAGGETVEEAFLRLRSVEAKAEGLRQLESLAGQMVGHAPDDVMEEFLARYADDGQLKAFEPELTGFQLRSLEKAVEHFSGKSLRDQAGIDEFLGSAGKPSMTNREEAREFLIRTGAWSPRRAEQFTEGAKSWSVEEEAAFWKTNYGEVPVWARIEDLRNADPETGGLNGIFHDQDQYMSQMRGWGIFNRSAEARLRLTGDTLEEIEKRVLNGDPITGVKGKRELDLQRRYLVERYGDLVGKIDKQGNVTLTSMPWMMYPDELKAYFGARSMQGIADGLVKNEEELGELLGLVGKELDRFFDEYILTKAADGPIEYADIFRLASRVQSRLLANPKWAARHRDLAGKVLNAWATVNRALIFTQLSFLTANVVDVPIKTSWYRWTRRFLFNPGIDAAPAEVVAKINKWQPQDVGIDIESTLYNMKGKRPLKDTWNDPLSDGMRGRLERATVLPKALYRGAPYWAGRAEIMAKMNLARGMAPQVYAQALKRLGDPDLAEAFTRNFVRKEIDRMWPHSSDHPLERLFNQLVPFGSYMVRNKVLFISEAAAHPSILNQIEFVGQYIEKENRANWEARGEKGPLPDHLARRIELPWAPGYFLDLGQFSDATRGLKPLYNAAKGPMSYLDFTAQWVRLVNPSVQAGIYMLTNALGITQRVAWQPVLNEDGFVTGYKKVITGWTEPWSEDQPDWGSVVWVAHVIEEAQKAGLDGKWSNGEIAQLLGKLTMFDAIEGVDRGYGLYEYYKALKAKNEGNALKWLAETNDGIYLQSWLLAKNSELQDAKYRQLQIDLNLIGDEHRFWHTASPAFRKAVEMARNNIDRIEAAYEDKLYGMTPGTKEYRETRAEMFFFISEVYKNSPELMISEVYSKDASEWSKQLARWQTGKLMDEFFALDKQRPNRADYASAAEFNKALDAWKHQKEIFLATYPQVAQELGGARDALSRVKDQVDKEWDEVLTRIGKRNEAIEAAKALGDQEKLDILYLQNELDFSILERDRVAMYFTEDDYETLPEGTFGPPKLLDGAIKKVTQILDFDARRYEKAKREGRAEEFMQDAFYAAGMKEVILKAKGGDVFGKFDPAKFVDEIKKRPKLMEMYFKKNPEKREQWRKTDEYIRYISAWGKAARRGDWDTAERLWNSLPQWVKDRYYAKHPERRKKAIQSSEYVAWLGRWVSFFEKDDVKGGMEFFWSMPKWVRERYFAKHPEKRAKWEAALKHGKELAQYFAFDDAGAQAKFLEDHPDLAKFVRGQVTDEEKRRQAILAAYRAIPKDEQWLRRVFREKYPEVFSQEALGERRLKRVYDRLAAHPEMLPSFERWVQAIWDSYTLMLQKGVARPRPIQFKRERPRRRRSLSAAELRAAN